jgi:hypothetical protein
MLQQRMAMFLLLIAVGVGMLAYGLYSQAVAVASDEQNQAVQVSEPVATQGSEPVVTQGSEPVVTPVVSQGEAKPAEPTEVTKTAVEPPKAAAPAKPAAACPT